MKSGAPFREGADLFPHIPYSFQGNKMSFLKDSLAHFLHPLPLN